MVKNNNSIGKWAFLIGIMVAILAALITSISASTILLILFILGIVVGLLNIAEKDTTKFLIAVIALLVIGVGSLNALSILGTIKSYLTSMLGNFISFVGAAGLIVSIKALFGTSK